MITSIVNIDDISRINWIITIVMKVIPSGNDYQFAIKSCPVKIVIFPMNTMVIQSIVVGQCLPEGRFSG